ncbi:MAG: DUF4199 domain-containing protein [Opitutaceae bacterium]|nr:DUF4199 domain-containing protein [Opitutaceae bacterium]
MKTSLTYGFIMALGAALLSLGFFFAGYHDDPAKLESAQRISMVLNTAIAIITIVLGMREKRALTPADQNWGYGSALGTGLMVGLWGTLFSCIYSYAYFSFINPAINEMIYQAQVLKMEESGMSSAQIAQAEPMMRKWMSPAVMTVISFFVILFFNAIISFIAAIFVKNRPAAPAAA